MVNLAEEALVAYNVNSGFASQEHAERVPVVKKEKKPRRKEVRPLRRRRRG